MSDAPEFDRQEFDSTLRTADPYQVVRDFEAALCDYTGARFAVSVSSCTAALLLAVKWALRDLPTLPNIKRITEAMHEHAKTAGHACRVNFVEPEIEIPRRTYVGVACSIIHAGGRPTFRDEEWVGAYRLDPYPILDSARWFTSGLFERLTAHLETAFVAVSFQAAKTLGDTQGGALLHNDPEADAWLRRMRFDGRTEGVAPKDDTFREVGHHVYLSGDVAARLLLKLHSLPRHNEPLASDQYPDLSLHEAFR